ncbi:MAG: PDZ domain-containing protein [Candidatus Omnitrophica bacterium]|nr:PDZ domain-containing protein [Candidatus Omnitrophota bacterium]
MSKENIIMICGITFLVVLVIAAVNNNTVQDTAQDAFHEVQTADMFKQAALNTPGFVCPVAAGAPAGGAQGYYPAQGAGQGYYAGQGGGQGFYAGQGGGQGYYAGQGQPQVYGGSGMMLQPGAMAAAMTGAPAIEPGQAAPELVKIMGVEAVEVGAGKVKITGVMGNSWAAKAMLQPGDILLSFNAKDITSFKQFKAMLAAVPPEKNYKITYLRSTRKKQAVLWVGEGEMEGFLPIK